MPQYLRRNLFRGWDWFTPREIQHLPWRERERLIRGAWETLSRLPGYRFVSRWIPIIITLPVQIMVFTRFFLSIRFDFLLVIIIYLAWILLTILGFVSSVVWYRHRFRKALRQLLLEAGIRPGICFECGYYLEGFEGNECPACDSPLIMYPDSSRSTS